MKLSKSKINTFVGEAVTLRLEGAVDEVIWSSSDSAVFVRDFKNALPDSFSDRVIVVPKKTGTYTVKAVCSGQEFECALEIREMKKYKKGDKLNYYFADFHNHTSMDHQPESFRKRENDMPDTAINTADKDGLLDAMAVSDHADITDNNDFFRTMEAAEKYQGDMVVFGGMESEINVMERDVYGKLYKNSGEAVTFNADNYASVSTWDEFFEKMSENPYAVAKFAHPQVLGFGKMGLWNFQFDKNSTDRMKKIFRLIEMGKGTAAGSNMINEYAYSKALDYGFKVSPDSSSDCHGPEWGFGATIGKTIVLAPEKSKEMFLDAIYSNRIYATESGNVKLFYTVNGYICGETIPLCNKYDFEIDIDCFDKEKECKITKLEIISDFGKSVYKKEGNIEKTEKVSVNSDTARYFFVRLCDEQGYRTWSAPVWCSREFEKYVEREFVPVNELLQSAVDLTSGKDASTLIDGDVFTTWEAENVTAEIEVTLKKAEKISAVGLYHFVFTTGELNKLSPGNVGKLTPHYVSSYPKEYEVFVADEDKNYKKAAEGDIRIFGEEHKVLLPDEKIKYIKIKVLSTAGSVSEKNIYNENVKLAAVNIYK